MYLRGAAKATLLLLFLEKSTKLCHRCCSFWLKYPPNRL